MSSNLEPIIRWSIQADWHSMTNVVNGNTWTAKPAYIPHQSIERSEWLKMERNWCVYEQILGYSRTTFCFANWRRTRILLLRKWAIYSLKVSYILVIYRIIYHWGILQIVALIRMVYRNSSEVQRPSVNGAIATELGYKLSECGSTHSLLSAACLVVHNSMG